MKIREKIKVGVGVPLVIFLVFAVISYIHAEWIELKFTQVTEVESPKSEAASKMEVDLIGIGSELMGYTRDHGPASLESIQEYDKDFRRCLNTYRRLAEETEAEPLEIAADKNYSILDKTVEELINLENYQIQKLTILHNNFEEADRILSEELVADIKAGELYAYEKLKAIVQMKSGIDEIKFDLHHYLMGDNQQYYEDKIYKHQQDAERFADTYKELEPVSEETQWLGQLSDIHAESMRLVKDVIALEKKKKDNLEEYARAKDNLHLVFGNNIEETNATFEEVKRSSQKAMSIYIIAVPVMVFVGLIITLIFQAYITYLITLPITELRDATVKISQGKHDTKIQVESDDEFGQLADSIRTMAKELEKSRMLLLDEHNEEIARLEKVGASPQS